MKKNETISKVRIMHVGAGYWGKNLIRNFHGLGALELICDNEKGTLARFSEQYPDVRSCGSFDEALSDGSVDAVSIATPAETHYELVRKSLESGKHVFVEKPLCLDVEDGRQLVEMARERNLILMLGHLLHYHPAVTKIKKMVNEGRLGRLQYIYSNRLNLGKIRTEENILWSFAPHDISVILSLAGAPETVSAFGSHFLNKQVADVTVSALSFPSGVSAHIFVSWLHPFKEQKLVIVGDGGMLVFNDVEPEDKILFYKHTIEWRNGAPLPNKADAEKIEWEKKEPLREECSHFLRCVGDKGKPLTDGVEGLKVLQVLHACQASISKGGAPIEFSPKAREHASTRIANYHAHETAVIDDGVSIGDGTKIWHFSHMLSGSNIGPNCSIGQNVVIGPDVQIGAGCKIQNNISVYKGVTLEDNVFCGPSTVFTNVFNPRSSIRRMDELRTTLVRSGATIGANATIVCGVTLGRYCFVGAGAVVLADVPDYAMVVGNPAVRKGWMCECGVKLSVQDGGAECSECAKSYVLSEGALSSTG